MGQYQGEGGVNEACEDILARWRGGELAACLAGQDVFPPSSWANRIVTWSDDDEPIKRTMDQVDWAVSRSMDLSVQKLHFRRRSNDVVIPRFLAMYLMSIFCPDRSLVEIAKHFSMVDHTSIMNGIRRAKAMLKEDPDFCAAHERARRILAGMEA